MRHWQVFSLLRGLRFCPAEGEIKRENFEALIAMLDYSLDTKRKRHIAGGIFLSISLLFGGFAFTAMTLKQEDDKNE